MKINTAIDPHACIPVPPSLQPAYEPWEAIKRRRGRLRLTSELIKASPETAMRIFARMIIVRAEHSFMNDIIEYEAYSPLFRALEEGEKAPFYNFEVDDEGPVKAIELGYDR